MLFEHGLSWVDSLDDGAPGKGRVLCGLGQNQLDRFRFRVMNYVDVLCFTQVVHPVGACYVGGTSIRI